MEEIYKLLFEQAHDGIFVASAAGQLVAVNNSSHRMLGYAPGQLAGLHVREICRPADHEKQRNQFDAVKAGASLTDEWTLVRRDGSLLQVELTAQLLGNGMVLSIVRDLSDRIRARQALADSEARLRALINALPEPALILDGQLRLTACNEALARSLGVPLDLLPGRYLRELLGHTPVAQDRLRRVEQVLQTREAQIFEDENHGRYFRNFIYPVQADAGASGSVAIFAIDQTAARTAQEAIQRSEAHLKSVLSTALDIILNVDRQGRILFINRTHIDRSPGEIVGTSCFEYVPEEFRPRIQAALERVFEERAIVEYETQGPVLPDGTRPWTSVRVGPLLKDGAVVAATMCATDITGRKQLEDALVALAGGMTGKTGARLYTAVELLAKFLNADYAFVGEPMPHQPGRIHTLAMWTEGKPGQNFDYALRDTPCHEVMQYRFCYYPARVQELFPNDLLLPQMGIHAYAGVPLMSSSGKAIGLLVVMWKQPKATSGLEQSFFNACASIAGAELERFQAEESMQDALLRLSVATDSGGIGTWDWDIHNNALRWDARMYRLYGVNPEGFGGVYEAWEQAVHPDDLPAARATLQCAVQGTRGFHTEFRVVWPDGQIRHIEGHGLVLREPDGTPKRMIGVNWDITDRKSNEAALRESEARLSAIVETTPNVAIQLYSRDGRVLSWNRASERMFGFTAAEALGKTLDQLIHTPDETRGFLEVLGKIEASGQGVGPAEYEFRRKDGSKGWCLSTTFAIPAGGQPNFVCMDVDITERKAAEQQLQQAQKVDSIGRLAGGVAHDFNNLLTSILGFAEFARNEVPPDSNAAGNLARVIESANRGANLTQQLLAFARKKIVKPEVLDLNRVIVGIEPLLRRLIGEDLELVFVPAARLGLVKVDLGGIEQVIVNLAVNARDAMPRGGQLTIETQSVTLGQDYALQHAEVTPGRYVMLAVTDTGIGMSPEVLQRVFEPFFTTKPVGQGTGLGLSMCHGIVKQAGGHILVYSEPGKGTTFKLYLPMAKEAGTRIAAVPGAETPQGGNETVLFVEDDELVRDFAEQCLTGLGYTVITAANGMDALERIAQTSAPIHLLITDVVMPKLNGPGLASRLAQSHPRLKVIYASGYTENAIVQHGVLHPNINFIQKPYSSTAMAKKIREVLDRDK